VRQIVRCVRLRFLNLAVHRVRRQVDLARPSHSTMVHVTGAGRPPVKLYFDADSGLLARLVRYTGTPVGSIPTQIDYADYRDVSGIKMAFKWTTTWTDGRSVTELSSVEVNAPVDAEKFAQSTH
jgi:hypothetical protein